MAEPTVIEVEVAGSTPLIMHKFTDEAAQQATEGHRTSSASSDEGTPEQIAEQFIYQDEDGNVIVPQPNVFSAIIEAGKFFKSGKSKLTTNRTSLIPSAIMLPDVYYPLHAPEGWTVDTRPVVIPSTGGRILRHRPKFNVWSFQFTVELDTDEISEKLCREVIDAAGKKIGLGDFRPACKGPFGRFVVEHWVNLSEK